MADPTYWPWWAGALGLGGVAMLHYGLARTTFGVSGVYHSLMNWRAEAEAAESAAALEAAGGAEAMADQAAAAAAAMLESMDPAEFGMSPEEMAAMMAAMAEDTAGPVSLDEPPIADEAPPSTTPKAPPLANLMFLVGIALGGALVATVRGGVTVSIDASGTLQQWVGAGWAAVAALFAGGMLVGFGARMMGGCTGGHGLNGCATRQPGSLVSTPVFVATAVAVALVLSGGGA